MGDPFRLPPGATLESDSAIKLPPGATLEDKPAHVYDPTSPEDNPGGYLMAQAQAAYRARKAAGQRQPAPGISEGPGLMEGVGEWVPKSFGREGIGGGLMDIARGNIARGGHEVISGASNAALPAMPYMVMANPAMAARALAGGYVVGKGAELGAGAMGANPEQQEFAGDIGNLAGGFTAASGLVRSLLETPTKEALAALGRTITPERAQTWLKILSPRKAAIEFLEDIATKKTTPAASTAGDAGQAADRQAAANTLRKMIQPEPAAAPAPAPAAAPEQPASNFYGKTKPRSNLKANQRQMASATGSTAPGQAAGPHPPEIMRILSKPGEPTAEEMATLKAYFDRVKRIGIQPPKDFSLGSMKYGSPEE